MVLLRASSWKQHVGILSQAEDHRLSGSSMYCPTYVPSRGKSELGRKKQGWRSLSCLVWLQHRQVLHPVVDGTHSPMSQFMQALLGDGGNPLRVHNREEHGEGPR